MADHDSPDHETAASHGRAADGPRRFGDAISGQVAAPRMLLVWDAPNMDMGLGAIIGGRPTAAYRPRFDALGRWLLRRTDAIAGTSGITPEPRPQCSPTSPRQRRGGAALGRRPAQCRFRGVRQAQTDRRQRRRRGHARTHRTAPPPPDWPASSSHPPTDRHFVSHFSRFRRWGSRSPSSASANTRAGRCPPKAWNSSIWRISTAYSGTAAPNRSRFAARRGRLAHPVPLLRPVALVSAPTKATTQAVLETIVPIDVRSMF